MPQNVEGCTEGEEVQGFCVIIVVVAKVGGEAAGAAVELPNSIDALSSGGLRQGSVEYSYYCTTVLYWIIQSLFIVWLAMSPEYRALCKAHNRASEQSTENQVFSRVQELCRIPETSQWRHCCLYNKGI